PPVHVELHLWFEPRRICQSPEPSRRLRCPEQDVRRLELRDPRLAVDGAVAPVEREPAAVLDVEPDATAHPAPPQVALRRVAVELAMEAQPGRSAAQPERQRGPEQLLQACGAGNVPAELAQDGQLSWHPSMSSCFARRGSLIVR